MELADPDNCIIDITSVDGKVYKLDINKPIPIINSASRLNLQSKKRQRKRNKVCLGRKRKPVKPPFKKANKKPLPEPVQANYPIDEDLVAFLDARKVPEDYMIRLRRQTTSNASDSTSSLNINRVEYELDDQDLIWIARYGNAVGLGEDKLEMLIDLFEKHAIFANRNAPAMLSSGRSGEQVDAEALCAVCLEDESNEANSIVFCDRCNMPVHQECYGIPYIPVGEWICQRCLYSPSCEQRCMLCPSSKGALKQTEDKHWVHILCVNMIDELRFINTVFLDPACSLSKLSLDRGRLRCCLCRVEEGACIQCNGVQCFRAFHVTCAQSHGYWMKSASSCNDRSEVYCPEHTPASVWSSDASDFADFVRKRKACFDDAMEKMSRGWCRQSKFDSFVSLEDREMIYEQVKTGLKNPNETFRRVYNYWKIKRFMRNGVPMIARLQAEARASMVRKKDHFDVLTFRRIISLRQEMESLRQILELVRKREKLKMASIRNIFGQFEGISEPKRSVAVPSIRKTKLSSIIEELIKLDQDQVFLNPITDEMAPGYRSIIKRPMCLLKMKAKYSGDANTVDGHGEDSGEFDQHSLDSLTADFQLMISNCLRYNQKGSPIYEYAVDYKHRSSDILPGLRDSKRSTTTTTATITTVVTIKTTKQLRRRRRWKRSY